jgi:N-acetylneuraminic acid mutarotase
MGGGSVDAWRPMGTMGAPSTGRANTAYVWTGSELLIWGGDPTGGSSPVSSGYRYDPVLSRWVMMSSSGAPTPRLTSTAVWTGSQMLIWGGTEVVGTTLTQLSTGGRYLPGSNAWIQMTPIGAPSGRYAHSAVWTGSEMIIWGGYGTSATDLQSDGARYDPDLNQWSTLATSGAPSARYLHSTVWTGTDMVVWGGHGPGLQDLDDGARYEAASRTWFPLPTTGAPGARGGHYGVWTGSEMIVWGGGNNAQSFGDGGRWNAGTNQWASMTTTGAPRAHTRGRGVWGGHELLVWTGVVSGSPVSEGGRYDPFTNTWAPISTVNAPEGHDYPAAVWTGTELLIWGGDFSDNLGGAYTP